MSTELEKQAETNKGNQTSAQVDALVMPQNAQPMETAPKDGTPIQLLIRHNNYQYATDDDKKNWEEWCGAMWTNFNGGGWVWNGICGNPIGWRYAV